MINVPVGARVLLATRPIDFRKGAHSLAALAQEVLAEDPFSGAVIVYRAKRSDRLKILIWDSSGLVLVWKQLQQGSFRWPPIMDGVMKLLSSPLCSMGWIGRAFRPQRGFSNRRSPRRIRCVWIRRATTCRACPKA